MGGGEGETAPDSGDVVPPSMALRRSAAPVPGNTVRTRPEVVLAEVAVAGAERGAELLAVLGVERVQQPPGPGQHRCGMAKLDPVHACDSRAGCRAFPGRHRREPRRHERVGDDRQTARVMDGVNRVLNRHVHANLPVQEEPEDMDPRRKRRGDLLAADDVDPERSAGLDRRCKVARSCRDR